MTMRKPIARNDESQTGLRYQVKRVAGALDLPVTSVTATYSAEFEQPDADEYSDASACASTLVWSWGISVAYDARDRGTKKKFYRFVMRSYAYALADAADEVIDRVHRHEAQLVEIRRDGRTKR